MSIDPFGIACEKAFPCGVGTNNEERESKTARKMAQVKERGWGGEERKAPETDRRGLGPYSADPPAASTPTPPLSY